MADTVVEKKETPTSSPDKKEVEKPAPEIVDEDSKTSENGDTEKTTENGTVEENDSKEAAENGDAKDACIKRKSAGGDAPDEAKIEGVTPEKKAKLDEKQAEESNGETETTA